MRRTFRLTLKLYGICVILVTGLLVGIRNFGTPTPFSLLFTNPDGSPCKRPCMFGIRLGVTEYEDAVRLLETHPITRNLYEKESLGRNGVIFEGKTFDVGLSRDAWGKLVQIDLPIKLPGLREREDRPYSLMVDATLGEMVAALGAPDLIEFSDVGVGLTLRSYYQKDNLFLVHRRQQRELVGLDDTLLYMYMYTEPVDPRPGMYTWMGFTLYRRYFETFFPRR